MLKEVDEIIRTIIQPNSFITDLLLHIIIIVIMKITMTMTITSCLICSEVIIIHLLGFVSQVSSEFKGSLKSEDEVTSGSMMRLK